MPFMKQNVNLGLLMLIAALMLSFLTFTVIYQGGYENITKKYQDKSDKIDNLVSTLSNQTKQVQETAETLNATSRAKEIITQKYSTLKTDNEKAELELLTTKNSMQDAKNLLVATNAAINQTYDDIETKNSLIDSKKSEVTTLTSQINNIKDDFNSMCTSYIALNGTCTIK